MRTLNLLACVVSVGIASSTASAEVVNVSPGDDLLAALRGLEAGDELILAAGTYDTGGAFWEVTLSGTEAEPILVRSEDGARAVIAGTPAQNVINLEGSNFEFRSLEIRGGSHGLRLGMSVQNAVFDDLRIHDVADVALSCNRPGSRCENITIRRCEFWNTGAGGGGPGEGLYLGCNGDGCQFIDSTIENNYIHDTTQGSQGDGIDLKPGSYGNVIRNNVFYNTRQPGILISSFPAGGGREPNLVEGNLVVMAMDNGIQMVGQATVRNNIVIGASASGISSKPDPLGTPFEAIVVHNTVVDADGACFRGNEWDAGSGNVVANNAFYCPGGESLRFPAGTGSAQLLGNVVLGSTTGATTGFTDGASVAADLGDPAALVVYPPVGSALVNAGDSSVGVTLDFNELARDAMPDVGAYEHLGNENPGWPLAMDFKGMAAAGTDAGPGLDAGAARDAGAAADAGGRDAGSTRVDAGEGESGGGGCRAAGGGSYAVLMLLALAMRRRRR
ncbi:MAG: right-handed parallel beta-helix repeat-containing protein [Myxococcota bacterium]